MKKTYASRLNMNKVLLAHLEKNIDIINQVPAFFTAYQQLKENVNAISSTDEGYLAKREGTTTDKNVQRSQLQKKLFAASSLMVAFATKTGNNELLKKISFTRHELNRLADEALVTTARIITAAAREHQDELAPYSLSAVMISEVEALTTSFEKNSVKPELAIKERIRLGKSLATLFIENTALLRRQMDKLAIAFADTNPDFYQDYLQCRSIKDPRTNHTRATGSVTNKATGKVVRGVMVTAEGTDYSTLTNRNGEFRLHIPAPGIYTLVFTMPGYGTEKRTGVDIKLGQSTPVEIEMAAA